MRSLGIVLDEVLIEDGAMEALTNSVIGHDDFGALLSAASSTKRVMVSPSGDTGRREHKGAGRPPTDPGLRARARYMAAPCDLPGCAASADQ